MYYLQFYRVAALMLTLQFAAEWVRNLLVILRSLKGNKPARAARAWFSAREGNGLPSLDECIGMA